MDAPRNTAKHTSADRVLAAVPTISHTPRHIQSGDLAGGSRGVPYTLAGHYRMPLRKRFGRWLRDLAMRWLP